MFVSKCPNTILTIYECVLELRESFKLCLLEHMHISSFKAYFAFKEHFFVFFFIKFEIGRIRFKSFEIHRSKSVMCLTQHEHPFLSGVSRACLIWTRSARLSCSLRSQFEIAVLSLTLSLRNNLRHRIPTRCYVTIVGPVFGDNLILYIRLF